MQECEHAAAIVREADALLITAGAGMGVDSGLPDFRGNEGFWKAYPPYRRLGRSFVEMANPAGFASNPPFAWGFYGHRQNLYRKTSPHPGFGILKNWGESRAEGSFVMTSNVDGHFQRSGFSEETVYEVHGSIHFLQCSLPCRQRRIWSADDLRVEVDEGSMEATGELPNCPDCGATARPNILMFGDWNYLSDRNDEQRRRLDAWLEERRGSRVAVVEFGAGSAVPTVRLFSEEIAARFPRASLIRVNPREAEIGLAGDHVSIAGGALETIKAIDEWI
jgi:NAD-dependent SIR2 family protein deacetylase